MTCGPTTAVWSPSDCAKRVGAGAIAPVRVIHHDRVSRMCNHGLAATVHGTVAPGHDPLVTRVIVWGRVLPAIAVLPVLFGSYGGAFEGGSVANIGVNHGPQGIPACSIPFEDIIILAAWGSLAVVHGVGVIAVTGVHDAGHAHLANVREAGHLRGLALRVTQSRQEHGGQDGNDRDDHKQLNERERDNSLALPDHDRSFLLPGYAEPLEQSKTEHTIIN